LTALHLTEQKRVGPMRSEMDNVLRSSNCNLLRNVVYMGLGSPIRSRSRLIEGLHVPAENSKRAHSDDGGRI
jgi:hypothetical protein